MNDFDDFLKTISDGKKDYKENDIVGKHLEQVRENTKNDLGSLFSQLSKIATKKEPLVEEIKPILNAILEEVTIVEDVIEEPVEEISIIKSYTEALNNSIFQQPEVNVIDPNIKSVQDKIKFLEQWVGKISMAGPGSGEVNLRWLDDIDRSTISDGLYLRYNGTKKKFEFAPVEDIDNPAQVNSDWNAVSGVAQILNKPSIPEPQVNSDWNAVSGVAEILNKPSIPEPQVNSDWNAVSGVAEILNKPSIPATQIQTDWEQVNNTAIDFIKNKPAPIVGSVLYKGLYNVGTNTPALSDATGTTGWQYTVSGNGDVDFGSGTLNLQDSDMLIFNGIHYDQIIGPRTQVNSDWDAVNGVAQILNKPIIPAAQVNSDWDAVSGVAQILNKPSIYKSTRLVTTATYTITDTDYYIGVNRASIVSITLPTGIAGQEFIIKDESGHASSNPITVLGNVDNDIGGFIIQINNGAIQLIYRNGWRIV